MISPIKRLRVLLVGAGRRVQNNFLPALACLPDHFEVCGIYSRTLSNTSSVADRWNVSAVRGLEEVDLTSIDVVAISVPTSQNSVVLRQLSAHASRLQIVIDTPIAWSLQEQADCSTLLKDFKSVTVTEDYMNFPRFSLVRSVVRKGLIGEIRNLTLYNIGYLYHGLALIRSFVGFGPVVSAWSKRLTSQAAVVGYKFDDCFTAAVVGPYRRHTAGGLVLEGSDGIITEFPVDGLLTPPVPAYVLSRVENDGVLAGFEIRGGGRIHAVDMPELRRMRSMNFMDKSDLNLERGCGLIEVFRSLVDFRNINRSYHAADAFYDSFVSRRAESGETPLDPFRTFASLPTSRKPRLRWIANRQTVLKMRILMASDLPPEQKIVISPGSALESRDAEEMQGDHLVLGDVALDGKSLPDVPWFIFKPAWTPA